VVVLFLKLEEALRGLLGRVETLERRHITEAVAVAEGPTEEQAEQTDLLHNPEVAMVEQVEARVAEAVPVERVVLVQQVQGLLDLRAQTVAVEAVAVLTMIILHLLS
jgi:hypothetical protein